MPPHPRRFGFGRWLKDRMFARTAAAGWGFRVDDGVTARASHDGPDGQVGGMGLPRRIGRSRAPTLRARRPGARLVNQEATRSSASVDSLATRLLVTVGSGRGLDLLSVCPRWRPSNRRSVAPLPRPWGRRHRAGMQFMGLERHVRIAYRVVVAARHHLRLARQAVVLPPRTVAQARHRPSGLTRGRCGCRPTAPHGVTDRPCVHG